MTFTLDWDGVAVIREVDMTVQRVVKKGAAAVLKDAKRRCPTGDSKRLRDSGTVRKFKTKDAIGSYVSFGGGDAYYAPFVELGTPGTSYKSKYRKGPRIAIKKHPFLRPALKRNKRKILAKFDGALK